ncbi:S9 family peptidase [Solicola gregarius]|uniref:Prolyl oligopeptidase family serine peptidase n=1 Tax=Solicola gregarius TaxID=2908642 RepID=A0AA46TL89_9ACTN|nr:prolyl oligopeptidase family serine peptidase [Solicola gregarius]UYM07145.1 prolyl oligopeptidase family serine peptidase [Solicola gregarius]
MSKHRAELPLSDVRTLLELPVWEPFDIDDEGRILAGYDGSGTTQLVEIGTDGSLTQLTALENRCSGRYVIGERAVIVQHDDGGNENTQLSELRLDRGGDPASLADLAPLVRQPEYMHTLLDVRPGRILFATNRRNGVDFDIVALDRATGEQQTLYDAGGYVVDARQSPSGREVAVTCLSAQPCSTQVSIAVDGGVVAVTAADDHALHTGVDWLPDGTGLLMSSNHDREFRGIVRVRPDGSWTWLVESDEHDIDAIQSPDGVVLLVVRHVDGCAHLAVHDSDGRHVREVALPAEGVVSARWAPDSGTAVLGLVAPRVPGDVLALDVASGAAEVVLSSADGAPEGMIDKLVEPTTHRIESIDEESIPCFVYRPPDDAAADDVRGGVVINIHGGPEAQAQRVFDPVVQAMVGAGMTVLVPNVRGSTGYGKRWYSMDDRRLRLDAVADLLAVREWVPTVGGDVDRVALFGGSYGGYLVLAGLAMQSHAWRAGVDIVGMSSLVTFLENTSDYRRALREREYGSLQKDRRFLEAASPLTYLDHIAAPLFVIHGANDPRVPLTESQQIKAALDELGVACELMVFDDEGHGLAKRANRLTAYPAAVAFLAAALTA